MSEARENRDDHTVVEALKEALGAEDGARLTALVESMPAPEALRHLSHFDAEERDRFVGLITPESAARLADELKVELDAEFVADLVRRTKGYVTGRASTRDQNKKFKFEK